MPGAWRPALILLIALVITSASGCLFPPVETPGAEADDDGTQPTPSDGPRPTDRPGDTTGTRFRTVTDQKNDQGTFSVQVGAVTGDAETHGFTLPERLVQVVVTLEWTNAGAGDLDLSAELREDGATTTYWRDADTDGSPSNPDSENCRVEVSDAALLSRPVLSQLAVDVSADAAVDTSYTVRVDYAYLVAI